MSTYAAILESLKGLARARQVPEFGAETQKAYLAVLQRCEPEDVRQACIELASAPREEYKPAMPEAGAIKGRALALAHHRAEIDNTDRLLAAPEKDLCSDETAKRHLAEIRRRIGLLSGKRGMKA